MTKYLIKKTLGWLLMIFLATNLAYLLAASFLDPQSNYTGRRPPLSPEEINSLLEPYNLSPDTPLVQRWWTWLTNILQYPHQMGLGPIPSGRGGEFRN